MEKVPNPGLDRGQASNQQLNTSHKNQQTWLTAKMHRHLKKVSNVKDKSPNINK